MISTSGEGATPVDAVREDAAALAVLTGASPQQHLTFMLGGEMFAMAILSIREIIEYTTLTEVPMMPPHIRGVINLRGAVVPVVDLLVRFGKPSAPVTKRTCIVIVEIEGKGERQTVGLVVDAVNEVIDLAAEDIEPPPAFGANIRTDFIRGMGRVRGKFVILLNVEPVVADVELAAVTNPSL